MTHPGRIVAPGLCLMLATFPAYARNVRALSATDQAQPILVAFVRCELIDAVRQIYRPKQRAFFAASVATINLSITDRGDTGSSRTIAVSYAVQNLFAAKTLRYCKTHSGQTSAAIMGSLRLHDWIEAATEMELSAGRAKYDTLGYQMQFSLVPANKSGPPWWIKMQTAAADNTSGTASRAEIQVELTIAVGLSAKRRRGLQ